MIHPIADLLIKMKKDYITLIDMGDPDRELTALEVFYLKRPSVDPPFEYHNNLSEGDVAAPSWSINDEMDVNENSAACLDDFGQLTTLGQSPVGYVLGTDLSDLHIGCCPVGPKGHQGVQGSNEPVYEVILKTIKGFESTQLNIASETAQEILALAIEQKIKNYLP